MSPGEDNTVDGWLPSQPKGDSRKRRSPLLVRRTSSARMPTMPRTSIRPPATLISPARGDCPALPGVV